jgi:hypothetical protein
MLIDRFILAMLAGMILSACTQQKIPEQKKTAQTVLVKQKLAKLSEDQRAVLKFSPDVISMIELAAGVDATPFYRTILGRTQNLEGESEIEDRKLAGFSVRTKNADDLIGNYRDKLRAKGFLIFKSGRGYGAVPDIVTVVRGRDPYDVLVVQGTDAPNYHLDTKAIVRWLKKQPPVFFISGAGADWVEARFKKKPQNLRSFAGKAAAFAPDMLEHGQLTLDELVQRMEKLNGFLLVWD